MKIATGRDHTASEPFLLKATGWYAGIGNLISRLCLELFNASIRQPDVQRAQGLAKKIAPLTEFANGTPGMGEQVENMKIKNAKDFWAGLIFIAFGLFFFLVARNYEMGTATRMGPAYFPTVLGGLIAVLGCIVFLQSLVVKGGKVPSMSLQPLFFITISLILFGYLLRPLGLVPALAFLVFVSAFVGHEFKLKEVLFLSVALIILSVLVFVMGLGLPFPVWPRFLV